MIELKKRSTTLKNVIIYNILSFLFLYLLTEGSMSFTVEGVKLFSLDNLTLSVTLLTSLLLTFYATRLSVLVNALFYIFIFGLASNIYLDNFNKIILILNFFYLVSSYVLLLSWKEELTRSYYLPNFSKYQLDAKSSFVAKVLITSEEKSYEAAITNFDDNSCFCSIAEVHDINLKDVKINIEFEGNSFSCSARVMTKYDNAYGFMIAKSQFCNEEKRAHNNWASFYDIISDRNLIII